MSLHKEIHFEAEIAEHLGAHGWHYAEGDAAAYDRARAIFPADLLAWVQESQPDAWEVLQKNHGSNATETLLNRLRAQLDQRGSLEVLRQGIELLGLKKPLQLAQFKPALALNPDILARYALNRLRVVRQLRYSIHNENSIDLVLFLNGLPVATAELKTDFTQSIGDAVDQYRFDRNPISKGKGPEPLLSFPNGALVHFAVSTREVRMTTKLLGPATTFLPFNRGDDGGAGNPLDPERGYRTGYLWEEVWERHGWLEILGRYLVTSRDKKKQIKAVIFPRYHQLDVTRKLQAAVLAEGPGSKYLVQHSAGSGKTKSIAWTAHFLAELHNAEHSKVFDTVLVVSDRNVIDNQLQEALIDFQRTPGVVASITSADGSKSGKLAEALSGDKKVVVCTIQTFPFALAAVRELSATQGKRFAVIADEAHSSQSGEAASKLKAVLSAEELAELNDGGEVSMDDVLAAQMAARAKDSGITFVAYTATPKAKTLELFGRRPNPAEPASDTNRPEPFHVYSMRQAIEEEFILDVLRNYTSYKLAFRLAHNGASYDEAEVEKSAALKKIMGWVKLHPYNISQKVQVVVEHFLKFIAPLLDGKAKAMVVVASRLEAVRWQLAIEKYIKAKGYAMGTLVAFSGSVTDKESGPDDFTETSTSLNPGLKGRDIREAFDTQEYQVLLVANKFQTGFDQPLLCGMYVDRRLAGIQAVQTLSRLNRCHPGKEDTFVVDFVNEPTEILEAFKTFYETAELAGTTDPNLVFDLRAKLDAAGHYNDNEVERVVKVELDSNSKQSELAKALEPVADRLLKKFKAAQNALSVGKELGDAASIKEAEDELNALSLFKADMGGFLRLYTFLSQIFDYGSTGVEKRSMFFKLLLPLLDFGRERDSVDLSKVVLTHHNLKNLGKRNLPLGEGPAVKLQSMTDTGTGQVQDKQKALLDEIIAKVNDLFDGELTDGDKIAYVHVINEKMLASELLQQQAANNTKEQFSSSPDLPKEQSNAVIDSLDAHTVMSSQILNQPDAQAGLLNLLINQMGLYEELRKRAGL